MATVIALVNQKFNDKVVSVTFLPTTPPAIADPFNYGPSWCFNETSTIYVPSASLNAYKTAPYFSTVANRIQAIPNN